MRFGPSYLDSPMMIFELISSAEATNPILLIFIINFVTNAKVLPAHGPAAYGGLLPR